MHIELKLGRTGIHLSFVGTRRPSDVELRKATCRYGDIYFYVYQELRIFTTRTNVQSSTSGFVSERGTRVVQVSVDARR